jgi:hypothetical protein
MTRSSVCCKQLRFAIKADDVPVVRWIKFREIGISVLDGGSSMIIWAHCPWCGRKLPNSLRSKWFAELQRRGIDPWTGRIPKEFKDATWYTKGLARRTPLRKKKGRAR